jgi:hypothetical protein
LEKKKKKMPERVAGNYVGQFDAGIGVPAWEGCVAVAVCSGSGLTSGSGNVAVAGLAWAWQCGHFEW